MTLSPLNTSNIEKAIHLYESAFPKIERRDTQAWQRMWKENPQFHIHEILLSDNTFAGFISYWDFSEFVYVEHFATMPHVRNQGIGRKVMAALQQKISIPIVLEVEEPTNEMATRRIGFYEKQDFTVIHKTYLQPPYHEGYNYFPLLLMATDEAYANKNFEHIVYHLYKYVYGVKPK